MATLTFDQSGLPAGVTDRSRSDIVAGTAVTVTGSAGTTHAFELLWKPPEDDTATLSGSGATRSITPKAGTSGTYLIKLTVDGGTPVYRTFSVRTPVRKLVVGAANEAADRTASLVNMGAGPIASSYTNEAYGPFSTGSAFGWWKAYEELCRLVDASREIGLKGISAGVSSTSGTTLVTKVSVTIPDSTGTWRIVAHSKVSMSSTSADGRTMLANLTDADTVSLETRDFQTEMKDADNVLSAVNTVEFSNTAGAGAKTIGLRFALVSGTGTISVSDAYIEAFRVA